MRSRVAAPVRSRLTGGVTRCSRPAPHRRQSELARRESRIDFDAGIGRLQRVVALVQNVEHVGPAHVTGDQADRESFYGLPERDPVRTGPPPHGEDVVQGFIVVEDDVAVPQGEPVRDVIVPADGVEPPPVYHEARAQPRAFRDAGRGEQRFELREVVVDEPRVAYDEGAVYREG